jgi:hypothetical protein
MPSGEKITPPSPATTIFDLDPDYISTYWRFLEVCLREVFHRHDADSAVSRLRERVRELPANDALFVYHDSPLQTAALLAGAADRPLTDEELLAYDALTNSNRKDRPTREQVLRVHRLSPKVG